MALQPRSLRIARLALGRLWIALIVLGVVTSAALACTSAAPTSLSTKLSGGGKEGEEITVSEGAGVKDQASLSGKNAEKATGSIEYIVYSDKECKTLVTKAGKSEFTGGKIPASEEKKLEAGAVYYWQAVYSGDSLDEKSTSPCGKEVLTVKAKTTVATILSGGGKEGEEITVSEGSKVKDTATLSGTKAATATGTVSYAAYSDKECKELASKAGTGKVEGTKVAASEEKELEAGAVYYWQAHYEGDSLHQESTSPCTEKSTVKAATSISTSLSGESKSGEAIIVLEGAGVKDKATLSGTNSATATGKVKFNAYKDSECKELAAEAGEASVSGGSAESAEKTLTAGAVYYWQASYEGDSLHQASTSSCTEKLTVKAATSISTTLFGEAKEEEPIEGSEITITEGQLVADSATLSGTNSSTATGEVTFAVYADSKCEELVTGAGAASVSPEGAFSERVELEPGTYYWQASYEGDALHQASTSTCGDEVLTVKAAIEISTSLSGGGEEGEEILTKEGVSVTDTAILSGPKSSSATGTLKYNVYEDDECKELVSAAGEVSVSEGKASASKAVTPEPGVYFWQAKYSGDASNSESITPCGAEVLEQAPGDVTLRKENAGGAALGLNTEVEGTSVGWSLTSPQIGLLGGEVISCNENKFVGEVTNNAGAPKAGSAIVTVKSWVFKKGGANEPKCSTTAKDPTNPNGPVLDAEITVLKNGTLHFPNAPGGGWFKNFELRLKLFNQAGVEKYVCKYRGAAFKAKFILGAALGLDLKALDAERLKKVKAGSNAVCWGELLADGLFTVETKPVAKPVFAT